MGFADFWSGGQYNGVLNTSDMIMQIANLAVNAAPGIINALQGPVVPLGQGGVIPVPTTGPLALPDWTGGASVATPTKKLCLTKYNRKHGGPNGGPMTDAQVAAAHAAGFKNCRRTMNPLNPRALMRGMKRLQGFQSFAKRYDQILNRELKPIHRKSVSRGRCTTCRKSPCGC